jgi:hypothetical protein
VTDICEIGHVNRALAVLFGLPSYERDSAHSTPPSPALC